jgi:hypothetical protein
VAGERWRRGRARALSDEGDDPGLTDRVGPPISEREATAESDKRSRRQPQRTSSRIEQAEQATAETDKRLNRTSGAGDGPTGPDREGGGGTRLGWKINKGGGRARNKEKGISELKIRFLNLPRLWKFVKGDLGGILT